jgi:3-oxoisoapionate decarboxylase
MKVGISSYTYTWAVGVPGKMPSEPLTEIDLLRKAKELDLSLVQIADNLPLHLLEQTRIEKLAAHSLESGIRIEVGTRGLNLKNLEEYISICSTLGSHLLRFIIDAPGYEPEVDNVIKIIKGCIYKLEKANITLAIENHDRLHSRAFREIMESINHPLVGICLDSVNSLGIAEGLESVVDNLAPYTVNLHIKDFKIRRLDHKMGFMVEGVPAGRGFLNLPLVLNKLRPWGRCKTSILELWTPPLDTIEETIIREEAWARESIDYLKQIL